MAYFAELDETNVVIDVKVVNNDALDSSNEEVSGIAFLTSLFGQKVWKQTSYNGTIRYNYAGVGYTYDPIDDAFIPSMPECGHDELLLNAHKRWECANEAHTEAL